MYTPEDPNQVDFCPGSRNVRRDPQELTPCFQLRIQNLSLRDESTGEKPSGVSVGEKRRPEQKS